MKLTDVEISQLKSMEYNEALTFLWSRADADGNRPLSTEETEILDRVYDREVNEVFYDTMDGRYDSALQSIERS